MATSNDTPRPDRGITINVNAHSRAARRHLRQAYCLEERLRTLLDEIPYVSIGGESCAELSRVFSHLERCGHTTLGSGASGGDPVWSIDVGSDLTAWDAAARLALPQVRSLAARQSWCFNRCCRQTPEVLDKVTIRRFAELSGYSENAVRAKIERGVWREGIVWIRAPDRRILISLRGYESWAEERECASLGGKPPR